MANSMAGFSPGLVNNVLGLDVHVSNTLLVQMEKCFAQLVGDTRSWCLSHGP